MRLPHLAGLVPRAFGSSALGVRRYLTFLSYTRWSPTMDFLGAPRRLSAMVRTDKVFALVAVLEGIAFSAYMAQGVDVVELVGALYHSPRVFGY